MKRTAPPGFTAHRELVDYIKNDMGVSGGPPIMVLASLYKKEAAKTNPDAGSVELATLAREVYLADKNKGKGVPEKN